MSLQYSREVFDRETGELVSLDLGIWMKITEFTELLGVPMRLGREILCDIGLISIQSGRYKLKLEHEKAGRGRNLKAKRSRFPFVVLSPEGQKYAMERWAASKDRVLARKAGETKTIEAIVALEAFRQSRRNRLTCKMEIYWLLDHFPHIPTRKIAEIVGVSNSIVFKYSAIRTKERAAGQETRRQYE